MANRAPLVAAILLLVLPLLYVGSYLALVDRRPLNHFLVEPSSPAYRCSHYPIGGKYANVLYRPLEYLDRELQPEAWGEIRVEFMPTYSTMP